MQIRPRRSVLYMPGSNERALAKAETVPADALILDLEDAVAPDSKISARELVREAVKAGRYGAREVVIRTNGLDTIWGTNDLKMACEVAPDAILVPKVSTPGDITTTAKIIRARNVPETTRVWAMMETPMSMIGAREIAATAIDPRNRLDCFVLGTNDLLKESRARAHGNRMAVIPWLAMTIASARAYGLDVLDGVYNDFRNEDGLREECEQGRTLGMDGKTLIHPSQVIPTNEIFSPNPDEVDWARKIIAEFQKPEFKKVGVISIENRMVERLHLAMAERTVSIADAIAELENA